MLDEAGKVLGIGPTAEAAIAAAATWRQAVSSTLPTWVSRRRPL